MASNRTNMQRLLQLAAAESFSFRQNSIDTEHLLLAMLKTGGLETEALTKAGANYSTLRKIVLNNSEEGTAQQPATNATSAVRSLLMQANSIAQQNGESEVYAEYVLFAILNNRSSLASVMLTIADVDKKQVYQYLSEGLQSFQKKSDPSFLGKYGKNLNQEAQAGRIDPVIGREKEINRVIQILSRRTKNNPVLIGQPGVGKTAIAEGLAYRIVKGDVPDIMRDKTIYSIDMADMVAGTKYRGDFEQRLRNTIEEICAKEDSIVFIDELHTIIGAGSSEGSLDASNILKPALSKGRLQLIGATTIDEYRKKIEKDAALERRLQPVTIEEPTKVDTLRILHGLQDKYENFHQVRLTESAIRSAVDLTDRFLNDRFLPDKAIDVLDEAMAQIHVKSFVIPDRKKELEKYRQELEEEKTQAALTQNFERAAELRDQINDLERQEKESGEQENSDRENWPVLDEDQIAGIVSQWANVPVTRLTESEADKYLKLGHELKKVVIGQDYAVEVISKALKRARVGLKSPDHPIGSFIFVGPTGVGKTYLAKQIAKNLFGSEENMIRIDMSEYMEKYSVSRLVGSAPGYVGYEEGGQLTDQVRSHPYSVVLFDEIEKAHPDVFNILLQVLDDGRLTDSQGRTVDFRNTIIIMTSNVGAGRIKENHKLGFDHQQDQAQDDHERMSEIVHEELAQTFRPEFLNRLDEAVVFHRLDENSIYKITRLLLDQLMARIKDMGYTVTYTDAVAKKIAKEGYDPDLGARPLERSIRTQIEDMMAERVLSGQMEEGREEELRVFQGKIILAEKKTAQKGKDAAEKKAEKKTASAEKMNG